MDIGKIEQLNRTGLLDIIKKTTSHKKFKDDLILVLRDIVDEIKDLKREIIQIGEKL